VLAAAVVLFAGGVWAQSGPEFTVSDRLLQEGRALFAEGNYAGCVDKIRVYSLDPNLLPFEREESDYLLTASAYYRGEARANELLRDFLSNYPETARRNQLYFMLGSLAFAAGNPPLAVFWLLQCDVSGLSEEEQADYAYRLGLTQLHLDNPKEASRLFALLEQYSSKYEAAAAYYQACLAYRAGDYDLALGRFVRLRNHPVFQSDVAHYLTQIYFALSRYAPAIQEGKSLSETYPDHRYNAEIRRIVGVSYYQLADYHNAVRYLQPLADADLLSEEGTASDYCALGVSYYQLQDYPRAVLYLNQSRPASDEAGQSVYLYLGQAYLHLQNFTDALRAFESASRIDANALAREAACYNYAMLLYRTSTSGFGEAITALEYFVNTYPRSHYSDSVNDALAEVYLTTKNYETALASIAKIKTPAGKILEAKQKIYYYLGTVDFANGNYDAAIQRFTQAVATGDYAVSEKRQAIYWRGESHYRKGDYPQAAKDYHLFLATGFAGEELLASAHYNLGYCAFRQNEYSRAESFFKTYTGMEKTNKSLLADAYARWGDCCFQDRRFDEAANAYARAIETWPSTGDYALFQKGCVMGLQKNYQGKIAAMDRLIGDYPQSIHVPDALYEKGRAYVLLNQSSAAIETFRYLQNQYPDNQRARNAGLQIGLLHYNANRLKEAAAAYQEVIAKYRGSEEANVALQDLKSVYFDQNDLGGYVDYVRSLGDKSLEIESIHYSEEAVGRKAETFYDQKQYAEALQAYEQLQSIATSKANRTLSALGILRSAQQLKQYPAVISAANTLLADETLDPEKTVEARFARAKAFLSSDDKQQAENDLEHLALDTRIPQGAEARYLLAQYYFDTHNPGEAKIVIQDYIQQGTPHAYWLAKSFILLSDIYASEGDALQARQYLESLQINYKNTNDDIHSRINERLKQLKQ
jgi:tetratricopeptide (TPR) repeat protein